MLSSLFYSLQVSFLSFFHIFKGWSQMFFRTYLPTYRQGELFENSRGKSIHCFLQGLRLPSHNQAFMIIRHDAGQSTAPWKACNGNGKCEHTSRTLIIVNGGGAAALCSDSVHQQFLSVFLWNSGKTNKQNMLLLRNRLFISTVNSQ